MNYQLVLECFKGDLAILYHLYKCDEIDCFELRVCELLEKHDLHLNGTLFQKSLNICILANIIELKLKKILGIFEKNDNEYLEDLKLAFKLNCKQHFLDWKQRVIEEFDKVNFLGKNFAAAGFSPRLESLDKVHLSRAAKRLLKSPSIFESFFKSFILNLARKIKDVSHFKDNLLRKLRNALHVRFKSLVKTREEAIGFFLASLELYKEGCVTIIQDKDDLVVSNSSSSKLGSVALK